MQINRQTYEEYFLLYVDGELNAEQRAEVEMFVQQHPDLKEELEILGQSVFQPDENIVFENKEILYKKEDNRTAIILGWRKIAVAAAILIFLGTGGWLYMHRPSNGSDNRTREIAEIKPAPATTIPDKEIIPNKPDKEIVPNKEAVNSAEAKETSKKIEKAIKQVNNPKEKEIKTIPAEEIRPEQKPEDLSIPEPANISHDIAVNDGAKEIVDVAVKPRQLTAPETATNNTETNNADLQYSDYNNSSDNNNIYFANTSISKKNNLKVIFRKTSRIIDRLTTRQ